MALTTEEGTALLLEYANASVATDGALATRSWVTAVALVGAFVGTKEVPADVLDQATLYTASELLQRKRAPLGVAQFATPEGNSPIRVARDPMLSAYPLLRPFVGLGIG